MGVSGAGGEGLSDGISRCARKVRAATFSCTVPSPCMGFIILCPAVSLVWPGPQAYKEYGCVAAVSCRRGLTGLRPERYAARGRQRLLRCERIFFPRCGVNCISSSPIVRCLNRHSCEITDQFVALQKAPELADRYVSLQRY